jgi:hypothetical protein
MGKGRVPSTVSVPIRCIEPKNRNPIPYFGEEDQICVKGGGKKINFKMKT